MAQEQWTAGHSYLLRLSPEGNEIDSRTYVVESDDGHRYNVEKLKFQIGEPLPDHLHCVLVAVKNDEPVFRQDIKRLILQFYINGKEYEFMVIESLGNNCYKVQDEHGIYFNLTVPPTARLAVGQRVRCVTEFNIHNDVKLRLAVLNHSGGKAMSVGELMEAVPCPDADMEHWIRTSVLTSAPMCQADGGDYLSVVNLLCCINDNLNRWIERHAGRLEHDGKRAQLMLGAMEYLIAACRYLLEGCDYLAELPVDARHRERVRLSHVIEDTGHRIDALNLVMDNKHKTFIQDLLNKLKVARYIYRPEKQLSILMTIFRLCPELINEHMGHIFDVIRGWGLDNVKTEPFRKAFADQLNIYINENSRLIDRLTTIESGPEGNMASQMVSALAIQTLIVDPAHDDVSLDINRSRLYRYLTLQGPYGKSKLLSKSRQVLATGAYGWRTEWDWNDTRQAVTLLTKCINYPAAPTIQPTARIYTGNLMRVIVEGANVSVTPLVSPSTCRPIFTDATRPVDWLQIMLPETLQTGALRGNAMKTRVECWKNIERALTTTRATALAGNDQAGFRGKRPAIGAMVHITVDKIDHKASRLYCTIVDEDLVGEGWLRFKDIVPYNISPSDNDFLYREGSLSESLVFNAAVTGRDADGMLSFEMKDSCVSRFFADNVAPGSTHIAAITNKNAKKGLFSCITRQGFTMWLTITEEFEGLNSGTYVEVEVDDVRDGFNIHGHITRQAGGIEVFDSSVPFHELMHKIYVDTAPDAVDDEVADVRTADDTVSEAAIRELALVLLHLAEDEDDYRRTYDLVASARMLALAIGNDGLADNCDNHMHLILALHDYATNGTLDSERLETLHPGPDGSQAAVRLFNKLRVVDSRHKRDRLQWLLETVDIKQWQDSNSQPTALQRMAQIVISADMLTANDIAEADSEIDKRLRALLNVGSNDSPRGRYYGIEDLYTEFKTSIIYPAAKPGTPIKANYAKQRRHIMERVAGMLNALGGKLYLGVNDMGYANGLFDDFNYIRTRESGEPRDKFALMVRNAIHDLLGVEAGRYVQCYWDEQSADRPVYVLDITPSPSVVTIDGVAWERQDSRTSELSPAELETFRRDRQRQYYKIIRDMGEMQEADTQPAEPSSDNQAAAVLTPLIGTPAPVADDKPAAGASQPSTEPHDEIFTALSRPNVLHNYDDDYVDDVIGYIYFMPGGKYQIAKQDRYFDLENKSELALAIHEDEENGYLVMVYADSAVVKVPIRDILDKNEDTNYNYCATGRLAYAIPMRPDDSLLQVVRDAKQKIYYRVDEMEHIPEGNINSGGERLCDTSTLTVLRCERVPKGLLETFEDGRGKTHRQAGYDVRPGTAGMEQSISDLLAPLFASSN